MATKYTATFADGTAITRTSERTYGAAWRVTWVDQDDGHLCSATGFSITAESASKSAYKPAPYWGHSGAQAAKARRKNEEFRAAAGYRVEIVPTTSI